jgi:hypothetical protein
MVADPLLALSHVLLSPVLVDGGVADHDDLRSLAA